MTISSEKALLYAILAEPENDEPREIYADWLEENGNLHHAKAIRYALWVARLNSGKVTYGQKVEPAWYPDSYSELQEKCQRAVFGSDRGFPYYAKIRLDKWMDHGPAWMRRYPFTSLDIVDRQPLKFGRRWKWRHGIKNDRSPDGIPDAILAYGLLNLDPLCRDTIGMTCRLFSEKYLAVVALERACLLWAWYEAWRCQKCKGSGYDGTGHTLSAIYDKCQECQGSGRIPNAPQREFK